MSSVLEVYLLRCPDYVRESVERLAAHSDLAVTTFRTIKSLARACQSARLGCVMADVGSDFGVGSRVLDRIVNTVAPHPIIAFTERSNAILVQNLAAKGVVAVLTPPVDIERLLSVFNEARRTALIRRSQHERQVKLGERLASLTPREREIAGLLAVGMTSPEIASQLHRSAKTVELHRARIKSKLEVRSIVELARLVDDYCWLCDRDNMEPICVHPRDRDLGYRSESLTGKPRSGPLGG